MIPKVPWVESYRQGLTSLRSQDYDNALKAFDKSVEFGGIKVKVLPSRDEVLAKLRCLELAFSPREANVAVVRSDEDSRRLLASLARMSEEVRITLLSVSSPLTSKDPATLLETQLQILQTHSPRNLIDYLRPEVLSLIGRAVVQNPNLSKLKPEAPFRLVAVSRRWRQVFLADPLLWGEFHIWGIDQGKKLARLLEKGPPRRIRCDGPVTDLVFAALKNNVASLTSLSFAWSPSHGLEDVWNFSSTPLPLTDLCIGCEGLPPRISTPPISGYLCNLTSLTLIDSEPTIDDSIHPLLLHVPNLESLELGSCSLSFASTSATPRNPTILSLPKLKKISIDDTTLRNTESVIFLLPSLEELIIYASTDAPFEPFIFPPSPHPPNLANLRSLCAGGQKKTQNESLLIQQLKQMSTLDDLAVGHLRVTDETIDALGWNGDEEQKIVCPHLQSLDLYSADLTGKALMGLVVSRETVWRRGKCAKLEKLDLSDLRLFARVDLDVLRRSLSLNGLPII